MAVASKWSFAALADQLQQLTARLLLAPLTTPALPASPLSLVLSLEWGLQDSTMGILTNCSLLFSLQPRTFVAEVAPHICHLLGLCLMALRQGQRTVADYEFRIRAFWRTNHSLVASNKQGHYRVAVVMINLQHPLSTTTEGTTTGTSHILLSSKIQGSPLLREIRVSQTTLSPLPNRQLLHACLLLPGDTQTLAMLGDPGADPCFNSQEVAQQLDVEQFPLSLPVPARALYGHCLGTIAHEIRPRVTSPATNRPQNPSCPCPSS